MISDNDLDARLQRWATEVHAAEQANANLDFIFEPRNTKRPAVVLATVCAAIAAIAVAAGTYTLRSRSNSTSVSHQASFAAVRPTTEGTRVRVSGEVIRHSDGTTLICQPALNFGMGNSTEPACDVTLPLVNANLSGVSLAKARKNSDLFAYLTVEGIYNRGSIVATKVMTAGTAQTVPDFVNVPCKTPAGGWPKSLPGQVELGAASNYARAHPTQIAGAYTVEVARGETVAYVLTNGDPSAVQNLLRDTYGKSLCVTRSPYTNQDLVSAGRTLRDSMRVLGEFAAPTEVQRGLRANGDLVIRVDVPIVTTELAKLINRYPAGLVDVHSWVTRA